MKIIWKQKLGKEECPYLIRWVLDFKWFSIRLHHWLSSDDQRNYHDHPWWYITLILWGGYLDKSPVGIIKMSMGKIAFRKATHQHTVEVDKNGCWSLLLTGKEKRDWGFWVDKKFRKRNKYFFEYGHHPCSSGGASGSSF